MSSSGVHGPFLIPTLSQQGGLPMAATTNNNDDNLASLSFLLFVNFACPGFQIVPTTLCESIYIHWWLYDMRRKQPYFIIYFIGTQLVILIAIWLKSWPGQSLLIIVIKFCFKSMVNLETQVEYLLQLYFLTHMYATVALHQSWGTSKSLVFSLYFSFSWTPRTWGCLGVVV